MKLQQPTSKISVVVPVYNAELYLSDCIESILKQTHANFELILIDDGSKDASLDICRRFEKQDNRVKVITKSNSGVSDTRNLGISHASGDFISFVDSDDLIKRNALEILHREIIKEDVDVVFCGYEIDYSGRRIKKKPRLSTGKYVASTLSGRLIDDGTLTGILFGSIWNALYKKSIIESFSIHFDSGVKYNEDGLFNLKYLQFCNSIKMLSDEYLYIYRFNDNSVTKTVNLKEDKFSELNKIINTIFNDDSDVSKQMCARNVTVGLWRIIKICDKKNQDILANKLTEIRNVCNNPQVIQGLNYIDVKNLNRYKSVYFKLIKFKRVHLIFLLTRYIYPALTKVISR